MITYPGHIPVKYQSEKGHIYNYGSCEELIPILKDKKAKFAI